MMASQRPAKIVRKQVTLRETAKLAELAKNAVTQTSWKTVSPIVHAPWLSQIFSIFPHPNCCGATYHTTRPKCPFWCRNRQVKLMESELERQDTRSTETAPKNTDIEGIVNHSTTTTTTTDAAPAVTKSPRTHPKWPQLNLREPHRTNLTLNLIAETQRITRTAS